MKTVIIHLFFLFLAVSVFSQSRVADSLIALLPGATDSEKIDLFQEISLSYRRISYAKVKEYSLKSYQLAKEFNRPDKMAAALTNIAIATVFTGNLDSAGLLFCDMLAMADSIGDEQLKNKALYNLGNFYYNTDKFYPALEYFQRVYPAYEQVQDTASLAGISQNLGNIYFHQKAYAEALDAFRRSFMLYLQGGCVEEANGLYNSIGLTLLQMEVYDSAGYYLDLALHAARETDNRLEEMYILNNKGLLFSQTQKYSEAIHYFLDALALSREITYPQQEANYLINLAGIYLKTGDYRKALSQLQLAEPLAVRIGNPGLLQELHEQYYRYYQMTGNDHEALAHYQQFIAARDSIYGKETTDRIAGLHIKFETARKEAENFSLITMLEIKEIREKKLMVLVVLFGVLLAVLGIAFFFFRKVQKQQRIIMEKEGMLLRERLEFSQKELALKALQLASQYELKKYGRSVDQGLWQEFETRFEKVNESFFHQLNQRFPGLTPNDRRICALLKLNMSTKDIALITHRSPRSIESTRYRLKKKFGLGQGEEITSFLQSI